MTCSTWSPPSGSRAASAPSAAISESSRSFGSRTTDVRCATATGGRLESTAMNGPSSDPRGVASSARPAAATARAADAASEPRRTGVVSVAAAASSSGSPSSPPRSMHSPVAASKSVVRLRESLATIVGPATSTCTTAVGQRRWCRAAPVDASRTSTPPPPPPPLRSPQPKSNASAVNAAELTCAASTSYRRAPSATAQTVAPSLRPLATARASGEKAIASTAEAATHCTPRAPVAVSHSVRRPPRSPVAAIAPSCDSAADEIGATQRSLCVAP